MDEATKQALLSAIRSVLVVIGSGLVTHGYLSDGASNELIGAIMVILPIAYGIWQKFEAERQTKAREAVALNAGIALVNSDPATGMVKAVPPVPATVAPAIIQQFKEGAAGI